MLEELRFGVETLAHQRLSIPYFLMQLLIDSRKKVKEGNSQQLSHHDLIRILIEVAFQNLRIPMKWSIFRDLPARDDIKTLIYDVSPSVNKEEAKQEDDTNQDGMRSINKKLIQRTMLKHKEDDAET